MHNNVCCMSSCTACCAGSSTQVGVLVVPFCVVLAWMMGQPLDLNFNEFEALVLFISVLLAAVVVQVSLRYALMPSCACLAAVVTLHFWSSFVAPLACIVAAAGGCLGHRQAVLLTHMLLHCECQATEHMFVSLLLLPLLLTHC